MIGYIGEREREREYSIQVLKVHVPSQIGVHVEAKAVPCPSAHSFTITKPLFTLRLIFTPFTSIIDLPVAYVRGATWSFRHDVSTWLYGGIVRLIEALPGVRGILLVRQSCTHWNGSRGSC